MTNQQLQSLDEVITDHGQGFDNAVARLEEEAMEDAMVSEAGPAEFLPVAVPLDGWWEVDG